MPQIVAAASSAEMAAQRVEQMRQEQGVAAVSVVLVNRDALLLHRTTGIADRKTGRAATADTRFRVGSVTKAFTGLALLRAQTADLLKLDQRVSEILPKSEVQNPWETTHPLRVAHLMEHTAGWFDMSGAEFDSADPKPLSVAEALALRPASRISHWPPGMHHEYSNSGAGLASQVLETVTKKSFEDYAREQVFEPLGMRTASLVADAETLNRLAQGYNRDGRTPIPYWHILYRAAGGLNLNPRDMAPFLRMLLNRGRIGDKAFLSPADIERFEHPQTTEAARHGLNFGYGLGVRQIQHRGHSLFGHGGDADGYLAHFTYSPQTGRGYFVVVTAFNSAAISAMQLELNDWLIENTPRPATPVEVRLPDSRLQALAGRYRQASTRFPESGWESRSLEVTVSEGRLFTAGGAGEAQALIAVDATRFRRTWEATATTIFVLQSDGGMLLQDPEGNWRRPP
ncbi:MAG: serine hydrolase domain-containing protein [Panacagrimonas sp.]